MTERTDAKWLTGPVVVALAALVVLAVALTLAAILVVVLVEPQLARDAVEAAGRRLSSGWRPVAPASLGRTWLP